MTGQQQQDGREEVEYDELPPGWEWRVGNVSQGHYTHWFGTKYRMGGKLAGKHGMGGYDGEIFWDTGQEHTVAIYPILDASGDDPVVGEYPVAQDTFESKQAAFDAVPEMIESL